MVFGFQEEFIIRLRLNEHVKIPQEGRLTGAAGQPLRLPLPLSHIFKYIQK